MNPHSRLWPSPGGKRDEVEEDMAHKNVVTARPLIQALAQQRFRKESTARARDKSVRARVYVCAPDNGGDNHPIRGTPTMSSGR